MASNAVVSTTSRSTTTMSRTSRGFMAIPASLSSTMTTIHPTLAKSLTGPLLSPSLTSPPRGSTTSTAPLTTQPSSSPPVLITCTRTAAQGSCGTSLQDGRTTQPRSGIGWNRAMSHLLIGKTHWVKIRAQY